MSDNLPPESHRIAAEALKKLLAMLQGELATCIHCGAPITELKQVGRSVYASPCGCRQYQGTVPKKGEDE